MHGVVSLKFFGPFIEQAEAGDVAPEKFHNVPGQPVLSQELLGPLTRLITSHRLFSSFYHSVPVHAITTSCQGSFRMSGFSGSGVENLLYTSHILVEAWALESDGRVDLVSQAAFSCLGKPINFAESCLPYM